MELTFTKRTLKFMAELSDLIGALLDKDPKFTGKVSINFTFNRGGVVKTEANTQEDLKKFVDSGTH